MIDSKPCLHHRAKKVDLDPLETFALACIAGRCEEARARLSQDPAMLERLGHKGRVDMLHRAVDAKQRDGVRLIVELGVDVNGMVPGTGLDRSALHNAAGWGGLEMVKLLLAGQTLLDRALARGFTDFANTLREYGAWSVSD
jgi:Ankyrin repeats (many copies)